MSNMFSVLTKTIKVHRFVDSQMYWVLARTEGETLAKQGSPHDVYVCIVHHSINAPTFYMCVIHWTASILLSIIIFRSIPYSYINFAISLFVSKTAKLHSKNCKYHSFS